MSLKMRIFNIGIFSKLIRMGVGNLSVRKMLIKAIERYNIFKSPDRLDKVEEDRYYILLALLYSIDRALSNNSISKECMEKIIDVFFFNIFIKDPYRRKKISKINGVQPPGFVTISPTNVCNLKCKGCYAGDVYTAHRLDYEIFDRIITDMKMVFSSHFIVISGGEPFMYKDKGKTLMDIFKKHQDVYFMVYTNGTLINEEMAKQLGRLGNITPAISVEGFEKETDERRGKGVWEKIMKTMDTLRKFGVPFGFSVTPCMHNADLLLSDEFIDFFFKEKGAFYGWYFQYMPIGRGPSMDLMVTPEQRVDMYRRIWKKVKEDKLFIADFWNSGTASYGCLAAGRSGGYFYIMWDGTITPCVFIPFKDENYGNIYKVYERGETLINVIKCPLFSNIRKWHSSYWLDQPKEKCGNLITPCVIRDNSSTFYNIVKESKARPVDEGAVTYLSFIEEGKMPEYNRKFKELADCIWEREYLNKVSEKEHRKNYEQVEIKNGNV
jgi:MoaA/NifB/PqqE/SkfB family radical SAM enzyme